MTNDPLPIGFGPQVLGRLDEGAQREWLLADGLGGYAMGTASGLRTRRYHGLLVVADPTPARRMLALAALDPVLILGSGARVRLGVHEWASGAIAPDGHTLLESFALVDGLPRWRWRVGDALLERVVAMRHGEPSVAVTFRLLAGGPVDLDVDALCTWRDAHGERHAGGGLRVEQLPDGAVVESAYRLRGPGWRPGGEWYLGVHARAEAERGLSADEDLWWAGRFTRRLADGDTLEVSCWAGDLHGDPPPAGVVVQESRRRAQSVVAAARAADRLEASLALAADTFVVAGPDVVAGYPWFGTWSRDTMTSYEGLFLETGRAAQGRELLIRYAATLSEGMLANTADTGSTEYNTADATLWFLHAVGRQLERTGDTDLAAELVDPIDAVIAAHVNGTRYGIRVDPADGLLTQGEPGFALTWMDARVDGVGITPRIGKAVELNALWLRALASARAVRGVVGRDPVELQRLHDRARTAFLDRFTAPDAGGLRDVADGNGADVLRPNQLLAASLPDVGLPDPLVSRVVQRVATLVTPIGLRSLAPSSPGYTGHHRGGPRERDGAYHQGTVWPWLIGPYVDAAVRAGRPASGLLDGLDGLVEHLGEWGLGSVSETADGEPPHSATGCPFQAWSVAEFLRAVRTLRTAG